MLVLKRHNKLIPILTALLFALVLPMVNCAPEGDEETTDDDTDDDSDDNATAQQTFSLMQQIGVDYMYVPHMYRYYQEDLDKISENNIRWIHTRPEWNEIEPEDDEWEWDTWDEILQYAASKNIRVVADVGGGWFTPPDWVTEQGGVDKPLFAEWMADAVYHFVDRYKDLVEYWEISNEINFRPLHKQLGWVSGTWSPEQIRAVLEATAEAVEEADPKKERILAVGSNYIFDIDATGGYQWLMRATYEWKIPYEIVGINAYPIWFDQYADIVEESIKNQVSDFLKIKPKIMFMEIGYTNYPCWVIGSCDEESPPLYMFEEQQKNFLEATIVAARLSGAFGYYYFNYASRTNCCGQGDGLLGPERVERPAWHEFIRQANFFDTH